jgi:hypothetical protein
MLYDLVKLSQARCLQCGDELKVDVNRANFGLGKKRLFCSSACQRAESRIRIATEKKLHREMVRNEWFSFSGVVEAAR